MIVQCSCTGCPDSMDSMATAITRTLEEDLWENGQSILLDIARREGLKLGPNREMQVLMAQRNTVILSMVDSNISETLDSTISVTNMKYARMITVAARRYGDAAPEGSNGPPSYRGSDDTTRVTIIVCTSMLLAFGMVAMWYMIWIRRKKANLIQELQANQEVVIGQPVAGEEPAVVTTGAPVTVAAPTKGNNAKTATTWLS